MLVPTTPETAIVIVVPERESLPPSLLANIEAGFKLSFEQAEEWRAKALAIQITSIHQKDKMKEAREMRLALRSIRVAGEKKHKELKADYLLAGRAIDGVKNILLAAIEPLERHLEEQEKYAERLLEQQRQAIIAERTEAVRPFIPEGQPLPALELMDEKQWAVYLEDAQALHEARIERAHREEAERIAKEQAEAAERERLRVENERLVQEAAEREAAAKAEREAAEKALAAERAAAAKAASEAAEKAQAERAALQAKANAERIAAEEAARKERAAIQAKAESERIAREKVEAELAAKKAAEEAKAKAEAAAKKKAAAAPDKAKLKAIAASVRKLEVPTVTTPEGEAILAEIKAKIEGFAKWIETQTEKL